MAKKKPQKINKSLFEHHACQGCSLSDLCGVLWCDQDDLERWIEDEYQLEYDDVLSRLRGRGNAELRDNLLEFAKTNAHVAKWLGQLMFGDQKTGGDDVTVKVWNEESTDKLKKAKKSPD